MPVFAQSSQFSVASTDAVHLLRYAPVTVRAQTGAVLHYWAPNGIWQGAPVYYSLMQGMRLLRWQASVLNPAGHTFFTHASTSPWGTFRACHAFETTGNGTLVRDELTCADSTCATLFAALRIVYGFAARREMEQIQSQAPTRELPLLGAEFSAG